MTQVYTNTDGRRVNRKSELNGSFEPTLGFQVIFWIPEDHETIADYELSKLTRNAFCHTDLT